MHIDRYMVNLFFEVRRNLPKSEQAKMKIASAELGEQMVAVYNTSNDENIRLLIEVFLERAGDGWIDKIRKKKRFRGPITTNTSQQKKRISKTKKPKSSSMYYRGVKIE